MSYAIRGNNCNCSTSTAITSNAKYIAPFSGVYYDRVTDMLMYPGRTGFTYPDQHPYEPENLKAWKVGDNNAEPIISLQSDKGSTYRVREDGN